MMFLKISSISLLLTSVNVSNHYLVQGLVVPRTSSVTNLQQFSVSYKTTNGRVIFGQTTRWAAGATILPMSSNNNNNNNNDDDPLDKKFGGYTTRQRLREEVESPFRTVRLFFFGSSTASALLALYFSILNVVKASSATTFAQQQAYALPPPSLDESLQSLVINIVAVTVCGALTYRDWNAGESNLKRIAKGGALARLLVSPMNEDPLQKQNLVPLADYRRNARIVMAVGGTEYIQTLNRSLNADQKTDANIYVQKLEESDVIMVPVLLEKQLVGNSKQIKVGDTRTAWMNTQPIPDIDRNFDLQRSSNVIAFPRGVRDWDSYLESELDTLQNKQNIDVLAKGFIIVVKKNGRILRRATGQPPLKELVATMEVMDGSRFGMPGDDEIYPSNNNNNKMEQETTTTTTK